MLSQFEFQLTIVFVFFSSNFLVNFNTSKVLVQHPRETTEVRYKKDSTAFTINWGREMA